MRDRRVYPAAAGGPRVSGSQQGAGGALLALAGLAACGALGAVMVGSSLASPLLLGAAITLGISTCVLASVLLEQRARALRDGGGAGMRGSQGRKSRRSRKARP